MARDLEDESYYISRGGKIPIRWSPPEVFSYTTTHIRTYIGSHTSIHMIKLVAWFTLYTGLEL